MEEVKYIKYDTRLKERANQLRKNQTLPEKKLWEKLRNKQFYGYKFIRQKMLGFFIADFYCSELKLIIEIDGESHFTQQGISYDKERTQILVGYGLKILRFTNNEILNNIDGVMKDLENKIIS